MEESIKYKVKSFRVSAKVLLRLNAVKRNNLSKSWNKIFEMLLDDRRDFKALQGKDRWDPVAHENNKWFDLRDDVIERDGQYCAYCGMGCEENLEVDHVYPKSKGGCNGLHNLTVACRPCNRKKSDQVWKKKYFKGMLINGQNSL